MIILRSFIYAIADGQENPECDGQRCAPRNINQARAGAVGEFNE
jgi:hypothetical protein